MEEKEKITDGRNSYVPGQIISDSGHFEVHHQRIPELGLQAALMLTDFAVNAGETQGVDIIRGTAGYRAVVRREETNDYYAIEVQDLRSDFTKQDVLIRGITVYCANGNTITAWISYLPESDGSTSYNLEQPSDFEAVIKYGDVYIHYSKEGYYVTAKTREELVAMPNLPTAVSQLLGTSEDLKNVNVFAMLYGDLDEAGLIAAYVRDFLSGKAYFDLSKTEVLVSFNEATQARYRKYTYEKLLEAAREELAEDAAGNQSFYDLPRRLREKAAEKGE